MTLEQLSAAAMEQLLAEIAKRQHENMNKPWYEHARDIARTGQLVAVQADDATVERVSAAICDTLRTTFDIYAPELSHHLDLSPKYWGDVAKAAISAMKDTQP